MSLTEEAAVCLRVQGIDDNDNGVGRVRRARGLINNNKGVGRGRGIDHVSKGLETEVKVARDRRRAWGIYDNGRCVGGGK